MIYIGLFLLGACWESFIQVVIDRVPLGMSFVKGRSCCNVCYHQLSFFDMFPVMNWIFLKGRCRFCQQRIPVKYPISEFIGGLLLIICFEIYGLSGYMFTIYFVGSILYAMSVIDFQTLLVYDNCLVMLLIFVIFSLPFMYVPFLERIIGCIGVSGLMMMTNFLVHDSFGGGDIRLVTVLGFFLGIRKIILAILLACLFGSIYASCLLLCKKINHKGYIAFVPFITLGTMIVLINGDILLNILRI